MRVVCVDDEYLALEFIKQQLDKVASIESVVTFQQSQIALDYIETNEVDVVFLDINMPGISGMELAEMLTQKSPQLSIVFITAYQHYAVDAFHLNAVDYLVKPIKFNRLKDTIQRIEQRLNPTMETFDTPKLYIKMTGFLGFKLNQTDYQIKNWRTKKAEELFLLLLLYHDRVVSKYDIKSLIWDDIDKGDSILHTTIYNIRKNIKTFDEYITIEHTNEGYLLKLSNVEIDVERWEQKSRRLSPISSHNYQKYERLVIENKAPYLKLCHFIWLESERERLEKIWHDLATSLAQFALIENKVNLAINIYRLIIERHQHDQEYYLKLMQLYYEIEQYDAVRRIYQLLETRLKTLDKDDEPDEYIKIWMYEYMRDS